MHNSKYFWKRKSAAAGKTKQDKVTRHSLGEEDTSSPSPRTKTSPGGGAASQKTILSFFRRESHGQDKDTDPAKPSTPLVLTPEPKRRKVLSSDEENEESVRNSTSNGAGARTPSALEEFQPEENDDTGKAEEEEGGNGHQDGEALQLPLLKDLNGDHAEAGKDSFVPQKLTPLEEQVTELKRRHPHLLLFVECGYRYRFFGTDAEVVARVFDISCHRDRNFMVASVPTFNGPAAYVRKLVSEGHKVGIVSQTETAAAKQVGKGQDEGGGKKTFARKLTSVYTRTTFAGEDVPLSATESMAGDPQGNVKSIVAAICEHGGEGGGKKIGLVAAQPTTGQVFFADVAGEEDDACRTELKRCLNLVQPLEVLLPRAGELSKVTEAAIDFCGGSSGMPYRIERVDCDSGKNSQDSSKIEEDSALGQLVPDLSAGVMTSLVMLIRYLEELGLAAAVLNSSDITKLEPGDQKMFLPDITLRNLEIFQPIVPAGGQSIAAAGSNRGTLFHAMNRTLTRQGARLLKDWVGSPLRNVPEINLRQKAVQFLISPAGKGVLEAAKKILFKMLDLEVALTVALCSKIRPGDFYKMCEAMSKARKILQGFDGSSGLPSLLREVVSKCSNSFEPAEKYLSNLDKKSASEGTMESLFYDYSFSPAVLESREEIRNFEQGFRDHRKEIARALGLSSFEYSSVSGLEYLAEVKVARAKDVPKDWQRMSSTKQVIRFRTPYVLENLPRLVFLREELADRCKKAWREFLAEFNRGYHHLQQGVRSLAELDCLVSLAEVSAGEGFVCPQMREDSKEILISSGRNLIVESFLPPGKSYVPNDLRLGGESGPLALVLTGPNMGGKSCLARQAGLICIMAQVGCFVPAEEATLPCLDALYVRVGARDDLCSRRSTLLVEMEEASQILSQATDRSLVLMDELGRGTDTSDGAAIARATLKHLVEETRCLTIFITHYQQVCEVQGEVNPGAVSCGHMGYFRQEEEEEEKSNDVLFLYKLVEGRSGGSFGLNVAGLAGVPVDVVDSARRIGDKQENFDRLAKSKE